MHSLSLYTPSKFRLARCVVSAPDVPSVGGELEETVDVHWKTCLDLGKAKQASKQASKEASTYVSK